MDAISSSERAKSNTSAFSMIYFSWVDFGSGTIFFCSSHRIQICAALLLYFFAIRFSSPFFKTPPLPRGLHASATMPFAWQYSALFTCPKPGWYSIWFTMGFISPSSVSACTWWARKLLTPMALIRPSRHSSSNALHVDRLISL